MNRSLARENAFILLFEAECRSDETALEIFEYAENFREFEIDAYVKKVFFGVHDLENDLILDRFEIKCQDVARKAL